MFSPDKIQKRALKTWYPKDNALHMDKLHPILGLAGEAGELVNLWKKHNYKPKFLASNADFIDEMGDCLYYLAILAYQHGLTLDDLSQRNRRKLENGRHGWPESGSGEYDG